MTPGTYNDPPVPVRFVVDSTLFPSIADTKSNRRLGHSKKKPDNHIPRPPNAFILFRSSFIKNQHVSSEVETNHSTLSKIIGLTWQGLPHEEREIWHAKAKIALEEHKKMHPGYAFRPLHTKGRGGGSEKRKVREVGPKDVKRCEKIAQLLVEGKKGAELEAAIQEFDLHHVPEVVTRFETPITARTYRRSYSAPVPDTETKPTFLATTPPHEPAKLRRASRATSSQPESSSSSSVSQDGYTSSQLEWDSDSQSDYYSSPSSPFVQPLDTYNVQATYPSFDLNTFSFNACAAMPDNSCDPLSGSYQNALDIFTQYGPGTFDPTPLSINTTFADNWSGESPPQSSLPGTPQPYFGEHLVDQSPIAINHGDMPPLETYPGSFDYFQSGNNFMGDCSGYSLTGLDVQFGAPTVGNSAKQQLPLYDRSALSSLGDEFSPPSYMAPNSTFVM